MIYLLFVLIGIVSTCLIGVAGARKGVVDIGDKFKLYKKCEEEIVPFKGKTLILTTIVCFVSALAIQISLYKNTSTINFVKLYGLFVIVFAAAVIDYKRKIIPNMLIICGLIFRVTVYAYEILAKADLKQIVTNDLIGFAIGFVFLALVSILTKGALGLGDAKLFGVIGLISGSFCTYSTLFVSLIISTVVSLVSVARKKMGRKDSIPFGPCIAVGYIVAVLLTSY